MKRILLLLTIVLYSSLYSQTESTQIFFKFKENNHVKFQEGKLEASMNEAYFSDLIAKFDIYEIVCPFKIQDEKLQQTYLLRCEANDLKEVVNSLAKQSFIEYVEYVPIYQTSLTPNDPLFGNQWALPQVNAELAWDISVGNSNVVIAVVDDAVLLTHEDLQPALWLNPNEIPGNNIDDDNNGYIDDMHGYDVADNDNDPSPPSTATNSEFTHGTHCAGIAAAATDNGVGIASVGYNCSIMAVKVKTDATLGSGLQSTYSGIEYAIAAGADVVSMSFGSYGSSITVQNLIDYGHGLGIVFVAAAGNDNTNIPSYPASYNHVISVGASQIGDVRASFSNYGPTVDVMAPGTNIFSTLAGSDNSYGNLSGTSMACPLVSGLVGIMLSKNQGLTPIEVENCLKSTCDNIDNVNPSYVGDLGSGRINTENAMICVPGITAKFSVDYKQACPGALINFYDESINNPLSWNWTFSSGSPASSSQQNPSVSFSTPGNHLVFLEVSNGIGTDTIVDTVYISPPSAFFSDTIEIIQGYTVFTEVVFEGVPPFNFSYSDGTNVYNVSNVSSPYYLSLSPSSTTTYSLLSVSDRDCSGSVSGTVRIEVDITSPFPCNYVDNAIRITEGESNFTGVLDMNDQFARKVCAIGDLDNDGVVDLAVGAKFDDDGGQNKGAVWILFLNANGTVKSHQKISDTAGGFTGVLTSGDSFGEDLDFLGDFDGDGVGDLIVGAPSDNDGFTNAGAVWILYLNTNGTVKGHRKLSANSGNLAIPWTTSLSAGQSVSAIDDVDNDGVIDIAIGAPNSNQVFVVLMNSNGTAKSTQTISSFSGGFSHNLNVQDLFGAAISSIGDLNQDGIKDIVVGAPWFNSGTVGPGKAFVLFLNGDGSVKDYNELTEDTWSIPLNIPTLASFGATVTLAPDMNFDGVQDLFIANPGASELYLFYMDTAGNVIDYIPYGLNLSNFPSPLAGIAFGSDVSLLGDIDENGTVEFAFAEFRTEAFNVNSHGAIYITSLQACTNCPTAQFDTEIGCFNDTTTFFNLSTINQPGEIDYWFWDFGDGDTTLGIENPKHVFTSPGTYNVTLIAGILSGEPCLDTISKQVTIDATFSIFYPSMISSCPMESVEISQIYNNCGQFPYTYSWSPSIGLSDSTIASPIVQTSSSMTYTVTATDANGLSDTQSVLVDVLTGCCFTLADFESEEEVYCVGDSVSFMNNSITNGNASFNWYLDGLNNINSNSVVPLPQVYTSPGVYQISLRAQDTCGLDSVSKTLVILPGLDIDLGNDFTSCDTDSILIGIDAIDGYDYLWSPGTSTNDSTESMVFITADSSQTFILEVTNLFGCSGLDSIQIDLGAYYAVSFDTISANELFVLPGGDTVNQPDIYIDSFQTAANCDSILITDLYVIGNVGIADFYNFNLNWTIHPNPTSDLFTISFQNFDEPFQIEISTILGQTIYTLAQENKTQQINTKNWSDGVYYVLIKDLENRLLGSKKLVISR